MTSSTLARRRVLVPDIFGVLPQAHSPTSMLRPAAMQNHTDIHQTAEKSIKSVAVGGHAPTTVTPTGKFCGKLCARSIATSARFAAKFCRRGFQRGKRAELALASRSVALFAACRVSRHADTSIPRFAGVVQRPGRKKGAGRHRTQKCPAGRAVRGRAGKKRGKLSRRSQSGGCCRWRRPPCIRTRCRRHAIPARTPGGRRPRPDRSSAG